MLKGMVIVQGRSSQDASKASLNQLSVSIHHSTCQEISLASYCPALVQDTKIIYIYNQTLFGFSAFQKKVFDICQCKLPCNKDFLNPKISKFIRKKKRID